MPKWSILASFWKPETCGQTVLPDRSVIIGQKLVENAKIKKFNCHILSNFQTKCFCSSVKRHLLSNATQWLKILKKVSFSNSLNFSSLSQNELFWRVEFEYNETFWGDFRTQCAGFSNCLDILKYLRNCQKISLSMFLYLNHLWPNISILALQCCSLMCFFRIAKWQWSKPSQQHPNRGGKTKYVIITMPKKWNSSHIITKTKKKIFVPSWIFFKN